MAGALPDLCRSGRVQCYGRATDVHSRKTYKTYKTYEYKLAPTAEDEGAMAFVLRRCCELYNAGLQEQRHA
jgi:hypothetical protein